MGTHPGTFRQDHAVVKASASRLGEHSSQTLSPGAGRLPAQPTRGWAGSSDGWRDPRPPLLSGKNPNVGVGPRWCEVHERGADNPSLPHSHSQIPDSDTFVLASKTGDDPFHMCVATAHLIRAVAMNQQNTSVMPCATSDQCLSGNSSWPPPMTKPRMSAPGIKDPKIGKTINY